MTVNTEAAQLLFPTIDLSFKAYHEKTILALKSKASPTNKPANGVISADLADTAANIAQNNSPCNKLFVSLCPSHLDSIPVFLYGSLTRPSTVAAVLTDKSSYRTYEQAARMMPASLLNHTIIPHEPSSDVLGVQKHEGARTKGMLLFSTTGRERVLINDFKGDMFKKTDGKAELLIAGEVITMAVVVWAWAKDVTEEEPELAEAKILGDENGKQHLEDARFVDTTLKAFCNVM